MSSLALKKAAMGMKPIQFSTLCHLGERERQPPATLKNHPALSEHIMHRILNEKTSVNSESVSLMPTPRCRVINHPTPWSVDGSFWKRSNSTPTASFSHEFSSTGVQETALETKRAGSTLQVFDGATAPL